MVKNKKKTKEAMSKFGEGFRKVAMAAATHPTTFAILVMGLSTVGQIINYSTAVRREDGSLGKRATEVRGQLAGLYGGAQGLGLASAVAPVAVGALNLVQTAVAARKQPT